MYRHPAVVIVAIVAFVFASGCDQSKSSDSSGEKAASAQAAEEGEHHQDEHHEGEHHEGEHHEGDHHAESDESGDKEAGGKADKENAKTVEVPDDGKKFEPSVAASKMPKGAWHCNMDGKVHYAAMKKGDGKCPVCNMKLKQK